MESNQNQDKGGKKTLMKKKPPQVRQTLTSKYRLLKANPLLAFELEKTLTVNSTSRENPVSAPLRSLVTALDSTMGAPHHPRVIQKNQKVSKSTSNLNEGKKVTKVVKSKSFLLKKTDEKQNKQKEHLQSKVLPTKEQKPQSSKSGPSQSFYKKSEKGLNKIQSTKTVSAPAVSSSTITNDSVDANKIDIESITKNGTIPPDANKIDIESITERGTIPPLTTPSRPVISSFKTPNIKQNCSILQDITKSVNSSRRTTISTPNRKISNHESQEVSKRLKEWLNKRGKSFGQFHHLKCFGVHTPKAIQPTDSKENIVNSFEDPPEEIKEATPEIVDLSNTAQEALQDLHQLILDGYPAEQCEIWLKLIKQKCNNVVNEPHFWECRAALEQTKGNIHMAVECYKTAIIQGAETQSVDKCLDQLLQKFNLLNINNGLSPGGNTEKSRIVEDVRNIFKSSIIQFAVQEKNNKKKNKGVAFEKQFLATPVRRSTRLSRSAFTSTPGVHLYSSLQDVDEKIRGNLSFQCNHALNN